MCACAENEIYPTKYPNMWRYMFEHTLFHVGVYVNVRFITSREGIHLWGKKNEP